MQNALGQSGFEGGAGFEIRIQKNVAVGAQSVVIVTEIYGERYVQITCETVLWSIFYCTNAKTEELSKVSLKSCRSLMKDVSLAMNQSAGAMSTQRLRFGFDVGHILSLNICEIEVNNQGSNTRQIARDFLHTFTHDLPLAHHSSFGPKERMSIPKPLG
uniref:Uncharacterized protein n=1 Tax=Romanomermis culicivorax TaxID=13658 RepID=A0A915JFY5_ROMCU